MGAIPPQTIKYMVFPLIKLSGQDLNLWQISEREAFFDAWKALKSVFGRGSAPHAAEGAYDAPPNSLVAWGVP